MVGLPAEFFFFFFFGGTEMTAKVPYANGQFGLLGNGPDADQTSGNSSPGIFRVAAKQASRLAAY